MESLLRVQMFALIYEIGNYELLNREKVVIYKVKKRMHTHERTRTSVQARANTHECTRTSAHTHTHVYVWGYIIVSETNGEIVRQNEEAFKRHTSAAVIPTNKNDFVHLCTDHRDEIKS